MVVAYRENVLEAGRDSSAFCGSWVHLGSGYLVQYMDFQFQYFQAQYFQYRWSMPLSCSSLKIFMLLVKEEMENVVSSFWVYILIGGSSSGSVHLK